MADKLTPDRRSWNMSRIRSGDTKIEIMVRKYLFAHNFRYRKNDRRYPGTPDIVLPKYHTAIFVHGCFWHQHKNCKNATRPKTNTEFWNKKLERNILNDQKHLRELREQGWKVITIWECELENDFEGTMKTVLEELAITQE